MIAIIFALIAFFAWGAGDIFSTFAARRLSPFSAAFWSYLMRIVAFALFIPFVARDFHYTPTLFLFNLFLGIVLLAGFLSFNRGLRTANPSIVGTIAASFIAVVVVLSILFFKDHVTLWQGIFIFLIFLGVILTSLDISVLKVKNFKSSGIFFAILAMMFWGIYFTFVKIIIKEVGWFWPNYISFTLVILLFIISRIGKIELPNPLLKKAFWPLLVSVLLTGAAEFCFNFAVSQGYGSIVAPIAGAYPVLFVLLAALIFREPLSKQQKAGILITLLGIVTLSFLTR